MNSSRLVAGRFHHASSTVPWQEPLQTYLALRGAGMAPVMLDGAGAHPASRYAYIAFDHDLEVRVQDGTVEERLRDGSRRRVTEAPLAYLRRVTGTRHDIAEPEGFTGGWIGYFGYEALHLFEPTLLPPRVGASTPDVVLRRCWSSAVFDRWERKATLYAAHPDDPEEAGRRLTAAAAVLQSDGVLKASAVGTAGVAPTMEDGAPQAVAGDAAWDISMGQAAFEAAVRRVKGLIAEGDLFQANIATRSSTPCDLDPATLFAALQAANPSPFMALMEWDDHAIISASPEQLLSVQDGVISSRPIAGTRRRGTTDTEDAAMEAELSSDEKEQAEHLMLVDLVRNDVARVSRPGSVHVPECMSVERYRHVMHLVSRVEGRVRDGTSFIDWMAALFPGGTITGAPKHRACQRIAETEPVPRGPYTGSAGFLSWSHNAHWNILIRTLLLQDGQASVHAGSGIVADSDPTREWHEAGQKAQALLDAATGHDRGGNRTRLGEVSRHGAWTPPAPPMQCPHARILVIDNFDSFTFNLVDHCAAMGATVEVLRNDGDWEGTVARFRPTHVILSPGPGHPDDAGCSVQLVKALAGRVPMLGVCLGHQAIARAFGGAVVVDRPVHGKTAAVRHDGDGLFAGFPSPLQAMRYHSLSVAPAALPDGLRATAWLEDGTVMSIASSGEPASDAAGAAQADGAPVGAGAAAPVIGLQFHPESVGTPEGMALLASFLATT